MIAVNDPELLQTEIKRLKRLLEEKEEYIFQLQEALRPPDWAPPPEIGLTGQEARIIAILFKAGGGICSKEKLHYAIIHDVNTQSEIKIVDVFVCKLRKKLKAYDLEILTHWGQGYSLPHDTLTGLKEWGLESPTS